jgi:hypothetical protein
MKHKLFTPFLERAKKACTDTFTVLLLSLLETLLVLSHILGISFSIRTCTRITASMWRNASHPNLQNCLRKKKDGILRNSTYLYTHYSKRQQHQPGPIGSTSSPIAHPLKSPKIDLLPARLIDQFHFRDSCP